jgi:hypothetical protein
VLGITAFTLALGVGAILGGDALMRAFGVRTSSTFEAFLLGIVLTATVLIIGFEVVVFSGGVNWITGGLAERDTAKVLARLGSEWKVAHNVAFVSGHPPNTWDIDIDHVAVGPYGILAFETKYSSAGVHIDKLSNWSRDIKQARRNAYLVQQLFENRGVRVRVLPVLIYRGWRVKLPVEPVRKVGDVRLIYGCDAARWLPLLVNRRITAEIEADAWEIIAGIRGGQGFPTTPN